MNIGVFVLIIIAIITLVFILKLLGPYAVQRRILGYEFPEGWEHFLRENVPLFKDLSENKKQNIRAKVQMFLFEKEFIGLDDLKIDNRMRVILAGNASLLTLGRVKKPCRGIKKIFVSKSNSPLEVTDKSLTLSLNSSPIEVFAKLISTEFQNSNLNKKELNLTAPEEFATAADKFFNDPADLKQSSPETFKVLVEFFNLDPLDYGEK